MSDDLVKRLRDEADFYAIYDATTRKLLNEAADRIEALQARCEALAGALRAHEQHMGEAQHTCVRYLVPAADPIRIEKEQFVSEMLGHFDGPEQRAVQEKANAALAQYAAI